MAKKKIKVHKSYTNLGHWNDDDVLIDAAFHECHCKVGFDHVEEDTEK